MSVQSPARCASQPTKRRAELTFKHNVANGRHGWLRLTPAYSVKIVEDILARHGGRLRVLDPFSGTGTTPLCAAMRGHHAIAVDVNPFLVWFGNAKVVEYRGEALQEADRCAHAVARVAGSRDAPQVPEPPIHNIGRWWPAGKLEFLRSLVGAIRREAPRPGPVRDLLQVAFCRTMIGLSNAAFNHQSMSFKGSGDDPQRSLFDADDDGAHRSLFKKDAEFVLHGAAQNPPQPAFIVLGDARAVDSFVDGPFDLVVTSPPPPRRRHPARPPAPRGLGDPAPQDFRAGRAVLPALPRPHGGDRAGDRARRHPTQPRGPRPAYRARLVRAGA